MGQAHSRRMLVCATGDSPAVAYASLADQPDNATAKQRRKLLAELLALQLAVGALLQQGMYSSPSPYLSALCMYG